MTTQTKTRVVEVYRCWEHHVWDTEFVFIPADTDLEDWGQVQDAIEKAVMAQLKDSANLPCMVGLYHVPEESEEDD